MRLDLAVVRFGEKLKSNRTSYWEAEYVNYSQLKKIIRLIKASATADATGERSLLLGTSHDDTDTHRRAFVAALDAEIGKVERFYLAKLAEYRRQLEHFEALAQRHAADRVDFAGAARRGDDSGDDDDDDEASDNNNDVEASLPSGGSFLAEGGAGATPLSSSARRRVPSGAASINGDEPTEEDEDDERSERDRADESERRDGLLSRLTSAVSSQRTPAELARAARQRALKDAQRVAEKRRRAWIELARQMYLLINYTQLNYTAVTKIVKKYTKSSPDGPVADKAALLDGKQFVEAHELHDLIGVVQRSFAAEFYDGDLRLANDALLEKQGVDVDWNQFRNGILFGACLVLAMWMCWDIVVDEAQRPNPDGSHLWQNPLFRLFRAVFSFLLLEWAWGILTYVWIHNRVNYLYVLDLDPHRQLFPHQIFTMASKHTALFIVIFILWYKVTRGDFPAWIPAPWYPFVLMCLFLLGLVFPLSTLRRALPLLGNVLASPFGRVTFAHACIGDLLTSMVKPLYDVAYAFCVFGTGAFLAESAAEQRTCETSLVMTLYLKPLITALPLWLRMHQNLRRYYESRERHPWLPNAFKYAFAHAIVLFGAFNPKLLQFAPDQIVTSTLFVVTFFISTFYTYSWDVSMDWGLARPKHRFLRSELMFQWRWVYYVAIVVDLLLRFVWTMTLVPFAHVQFQNVTLLDFVDNFFGPIEITRRCMWAAFRVENEHLHSVEGYRKNNDVVPLYFETPLTRDSRPEPDRAIRGSRLVIESVVFVVTVVVLAVLAVLLRDDAKTMTTTLAASTNLTSALATTVATTFVGSSNATTATTTTE